MTGRSDTFDRLRSRMVEQQLAARGIIDKSVLDAMRRVPRHLFVPPDRESEAYDDRALPLGPDQTISQPYIVALMLQELNLKPSFKVLEIGTGSGYQTALLAELADRVFSIELDAGLQKQAVDRLVTQGYENCHCRCGNGFDGWPEEAPFDAITVTAAPANIPRELVRELKTGGRMILPLGEREQSLVVLHKTSHGLESKELGGVRFVAMKGSE